VMIEGDAKGGFFTFPITHLQYHQRFRLGDNPTYSSIYGKPQPNMAFPISRILSIATWFQ
jgi:hypothetical protein